MKPAVEETTEGPAEETTGELGEESVEASVVSGRWALCRPGIRSSGGPRHRQCRNRGCFGRMRMSNSHQNLHRSCRDRCTLASCWWEHEGWVAELGDILLAAGWVVRAAASVQLRA